MCEKESKNTEVNWSSAKYSSWKYMDCLNTQLNRKTTGPWGRPASVKELISLSFIFKVGQVPRVEFFFGWKKIPNLLLERIYVFLQKITLFLNNCNMKLHKSCKNRKGCSSVAVSVKSFRGNADRITAKSWRARIKFKNKELEMQGNIFRT